MKVFGTTTLEMEKVSNVIQMETHTLDNSNMDEPTEKEFIPGEMVKSMMVSGTRVSSKATAYGKVFQTTLTLENGKILKPMVTEYTPGQTVIGMKANGTCALNMAKELILSPTEKAITVNMQTVNLMERESTHGKMGLITLETSCVA